MSLNNSYSYVHSHQVEILFFIIIEGVVGVDPYGETAPYVYTYKILKTMIYPYS